MANSITFTSAPFVQVTNFTSADGTTSKTIITADATNDRRIYGIGVWTDESAAKDVALHITDGTTTWEMSTIAIPINAGNTNAIPPVDLMSNTQFSPFFKQRDASGATYFNLPKTWSLKLSYNAAMTAAKVASVTIIGETYA